MKYLILLAGLLLYAASGRSQQVIDVDKTDVPVTSNPTLAGGMEGLLFKTDKYVRVTSGSPFFEAQFMKAILFDAAGGRYSSHSVRLNLLDGDVQFLDPSGQEMIAHTSIKRIMLTDTTTGNQYTFVMGDQLQIPDKGLQGAWFQVLVNGTASLCLQDKRSLHETAPYGTSTVEQDINSVLFYWLKVHGAFVGLKRWQDLQDALSDKKDAIAQYIRDHHLKGHSTDDYTKVVQFYNTL